jgi:Spy/CpxP family protein refolding chaperone
MNVRLGVRAQAIVVLALVAALGALVGILADRLLAEQNPTPAAAPPAGGGAFRGRGRPEFFPRGGPLRFIEQLSEELELTPAQRAAIDSIVAEERARVRQLTAEVQPRFRQIAEQTRTRIDQVLTAEQRAELRRIRQERIREERLLRGRELRPGRRPDG